MEKKKSKKADLESKRPTFFKIGLIVTLSLVIIMFEWSTQDVEMQDVALIEEVEVEEEMVPITRQEPPEFQPPAPQIQINEIVIVDNDVELEEELEIFDTEVDEDTKIDFTQAIPQKEEAVEEEQVYIFNALADQPQFPGGNDALLPWLLREVDYPVIAVENGIQGMVIVGFIIDKDGSVVDVTILRSIDPALDEEALRVVSKMPKWKPGSQNGTPVKVRYNVPIRFELQK